MQSISEFAKVSDAVELSVEMVADDSLSATESSSYHYGGEALSRCTSGFGTRQDSHTSGTRGMSTAAHCDNNLTDDGDSLTFQDSHYGYAGDFQWHTGSEPARDDFYAGSSSVTETDLRDVSNVTLADAGYYLCTNGKITHRKCGTVHIAGVCAGSVCNLFAHDERAARSR